jgi:hypothetical protein
VLASRPCPCNQPLQDLNHKQLANKVRERERDCTLAAQAGVVQKHMLIQTCRHCYDMHAQQLRAYFCNLLQCGFFGRAVGTILRMF